MNWKMLKLATPQEVYNIPANLFVAGFISSPFMNFIRAPVVIQDSYIGVEIHNGAKEFFFSAPDLVEKGLSGWKGREVNMVIRPEQVTDDVSSSREHPEHRPVPRKSRCCASDRPGHTDAGTSE